MKINLKIISIIILALGLATGGYFGYKKYWKKGVQSTEISIEKIDPEKFLAVLPTPAENSEENKNEQKPALLDNSLFDVTSDTQTLEGAAKATDDLVLPYLKAVFMEGIKKSDINDSRIVYIPKRTLQYKDLEDLQLAFAKTDSLVTRIDGGNTIRVFLYKDAKFTDYLTIELWQTPSGKSKIEVPIQ